MSGAGIALVVDDSRVNRLVLVRQLEALGLEVMEAGDGVEALELLRSQPTAIDIVLLDADARARRLPNARRHEG
jgi:Response regulator receiver domain.